MRILLGIVVTFFMSLATQAVDTIHHVVDVTLNPADHSLQATDTITIPQSIAKNGLILKINEDLKVTVTGGNATLTKVSDGEAAADIGIDRDNDAGGGIIKNQHFILSDINEGEDVKVSIAYNGVINNPVIALNEEYARGFSQSPGLIEERGIYLAGATYWIATVADTLITYDMTVHVPSDWRSVSQGERKRYETAAMHTDRWYAPTPTEEIYLIAAAFTEYEQPVGNVKAMAFLRKKDDALANKYLDVTAQYMEMYRGLLGPYPYTKFALVENFWETGYGMPSFTLLGPQIIRFPFILHSSYPHELLHNWWGNGVFIDFESGNWAEGLTAYMADHLVAEQRGTGGPYRRAILQRYTNYVDDTTDFALTDFRSRHNAVTEAVGYGKTSMFFNMLRGEVGDDNFRRAFQRFYRKHKYAVGTFDDIRIAFEEVTGKDLKPFFAQWVAGIGGPAFALEKASQAGDTLTLTLTQKQKRGPFKVSVPIAVYTADTVSRHVLAMDAVNSQDFTLDVKGTVTRVEVDPEFDIFRRLHWAEIPPSLGNAFGADTITIVLPTKGEDAIIKRYQTLAGIWAKGDRFKLVNDSDIKSLPTNGGVWVLGETNAFYSVVQDALKDYDASATDTAATFGEQTLDYANNSTVIVVRNPANPESAVVGLTAHSDAAVAGLARKLPHYGKYSYLAFTADAPDNNAKGEWPAVGSPMVALVSAGGASTAKLKPRPALAQLKPVFDAKRMMSHVEYLASPELAGRGVGEEGLDKAATYIVDALKSYGVAPAGDNGSYYQSFEMDGPNGKTTVKNVVGVIKGNNEKYAGQSVILSAHYDHVGHGWPAARAEFQGQAHLGADDNASGVAVLLEMAQSLAKSAPERSIIILATTAEESGLNGARHYVKAMKDYPASKAMANLNLDTVGRMGEKIMVFGGTSATEWRFVFMGTTATTGIPAELVMQEIAASDHSAFLEVGVPAVHLFGTAHEDYHRPSDTADKIVPASLMKMAAVTKEIAGYLAGRADPLTSTLKVGDRPKRPAATGNRQGGRRVSTGAMPDFAFQGEGVRVSSVADGSAGAKAGLKAGDVITSFGGVKVSDLRAYTGALGKYKPGDKVEMIVDRGGNSITLTIELAAR